MRREIFDLYHFEPVKVKGELYGNSIHFNHPMNKIKFTSKFSKPTFVPYSQIQEMTIFYDNKRKLLIFGLLTLVLFVGMFLLFMRAQLPPWKITLTLKEPEKPIIIRARLPEGDASSLADFCTIKFATKLIIPAKKARNI